ncbi:MAG: M48 family metalloprotease [Cyanobacteria bacterium P01_A01_bin.123]
MTHASNSSDSVPEQALETRLKQALTALKQEDYAAAIAQLTPLEHNSAAAISLKAQVGLVKAYMGQGKYSAAIAKCQPLTQSDNIQVQTWARKMLGDLGDLTGTETASPDQPDQTATTPETALDNPERDSRSAPGASGFVIVTPPKQSSGFVPLDAHPEPSDSQPSGSDSTSAAAIEPAVDIPSQPTASGFTPLADSGNAPLAAPSTSPTGLPSADKFADDGSRDQTGMATGGDLNHGAIPSGQPSIFHYNYLNQPAGASSTPNSDGQLTQSHPSESGLRDDSLQQSAAQVEQPQTLSPQPKALPIAADKTPRVPVLTNGTWQWVSTQRLSAPRRLAAAQPLKLWGITAFTAIAWFWIIPAMLHRIFYIINWLLYRLRWPINPQPISALYKTYHWPIFIILGTLVVASPWLFDYLLGWAYGLKSFSTRGLTPKSAEAVRIMRRVCQQRGWEMPTLKTLPTSIPLCFSYGCWPRFARIVVSQGILDRFSEDEIAALYAYEISHISRWDWPIMSGLGLCLQIFYLGYWRLASLGNGLKQPLLQFLLGLLSSLFYSVYWLIRKVGLWLSRVRILECDRGAVELTGNPNGLTHALIKIAHGICRDIERQGYTDVRLEGLDLLTPLSPQTVVGLGGLKELSTWPQVLTWNLTNPYRHWLDFNAVNPALGERLQLLTHYAEIWQLTPELGWLSDIDLNAGKKAVGPSSYWQPLLLQGAPYFGPLLGFAIAMTLWFIGGVSEAIGVWQIEWFYQDDTILYGGILMGLGIGTLVRINPFFPDLTAKTAKTNPSVAHLQDAPNFLPIDSVGVRLQGQLLGRPGLANWLGQDLLLKTSTGLIKLHFASELGVPGNVITPKKKHPASFIKRHLTIIGWFRRGATGWLDIDRLQVKGQPLIQSPHPIFATLVSLGATFWGIYRIFRG